MHNANPAMIVHGTDGSDGLEAGIHLRWEFNPKMGFPPGGVSLYRRVQDSSNTDDGTVAFDNLQGQQAAAMPYVVQFPFDCQVTLTARADQVPVVTAHPGGIPRVALLLENPETPLEITWSRPVEQVELELFFVDNGFVEISAMSGGLLVEETDIICSTKGARTVALSSQPIDSIRMVAKWMSVYEIRFSVCKEPHISWQGPINAKCGFGLPVGVTPQQILSLLPLNKGLLPPGNWTPGKLRGLDLDWLLASCRIPKSDWKKYQGRPFHDLRQVLKEMLDAARGAPMGWKQLQYTEEPVEPGTPPFTLGTGALDLVLMAALDPDIARMLGLYWVDQDTKAGRRYDYKLVAHWPAGTLMSLDQCYDFESAQPGQEFYKVSDWGDLTFEAPRPGQIVDQPSSVAGISQGLNYSLADGPVRIYFTRSVREVQLLMSHGGAAVKLDAYRFGNVVDTATLGRPEGFLTVHCQSPMDWVEISESGANPPSTPTNKKGVIIYKVCTDEEFLETGGAVSFYYGARRQAPQPLPVPTGLQASPLPGITKTQPDGSVLDHRFVAGLHWDLPHDVDDCLPVNAPVAYRIRRQAPGGSPAPLNPHAPVYVSGLSTDQAYYYRDAVTNGGTYHYALAAVDIWGRQSSYTAQAAVDLTASAPPPPVGIEAKYLDPRDPYLTADERRRVTTTDSQGQPVSGPPVLKLRWQWPQNLQRQTPDVTSFKIHLQPGWLNLVQGRISGVPVERGDLLELPTDYIDTRLSADAFSGLRLQIGQDCFGIISSSRAADGTFILRINKPALQAGDFATTPSGTLSVQDVAVAGENLVVTLPGVGVPEAILPELAAGANLPQQAGTVVINQNVYQVVSRVIVGQAGRTVQQVTLVKRYPRQGDCFTLPVAQNSPAYIDYAVPGNWRQELLAVPVTSPAQEQYETYVTKLPSELLPDVNNKIVYGQVGFSAVNWMGEGPVSSPAAVVASYRDKPPAQQLNDMPGLYATPANFYSKSSFALRWDKQPGVLYDAYRALDQTLFDVDAQVRSGLSVRGEPRLADTDGLLKNLGIDMGYKNEIEQKVIDPPGGAVDYQRLRQDPFKNVLLKVLANLPGNEKAFARLNTRSIHPDDPDNQDRRLYWEPDSLQPSPGQLLYVDNTLDGRAQNCYFYRIRTVNEAGTRGDFGYASFPVYLRKLAVAEVPRITTVTAGDRQISLQWLPLRDTDIAGYMVYRAESAQSAADVRMMKLLKLNPGDAYSVSVPELSRLGLLPTYTDSDVEAKRRYYYRVVAVAVIDEDGRQKTIRSDPSPLATGQAFQAPPAPPVWQTPICDPADPEQVTLSWTHPQNQELSCLVERRIPNATPWTAVSKWLPNGSYSFKDKIPDSTVTWEYRLRVQDSLGQQSAVLPVVELVSP